MRFLRRLWLWPSLALTAAVVATVSAWAIIPHHGPAQPPSSAGVVPPTATVTGGTGGSGATQVLGLTLTDSSSTSNTRSDRNGANSGSNGNTITDSKAGSAILIAPNLVPGGAPATGSVTLSIHGSPSSVTLGESNLVWRTCAQNGLHCTSGTGTGDLAHDLLLTVTDTTTSRTVYKGALDGLGQPQPVPICGTASTKTQCVTWANKESHSFTFLLSFPTANANAYQGTSTSVEFDWTKV